MKILLISGHGAGDVGAVGNGYKEADLTREVVNILKDKLSKYAEVEVYNQNRNAFKDVNSGNVQVNFANYNYVFEVHFNAGGGTGTEIYVTREEKGRTVEQKILEKIGQYYKLRGVKEKNFNVIYSAKKKGVSSALLEVCFIDNANDVKIYQSNKDKICQAICEGIVEGFGLKEGEKKVENSTEVNKNNEGVDEPVRVYQNGSTIENVYADTNLTNKIGSLNKYEKCDCFGIFENRAMVRYKVDGSDNYKIGFVKWTGGVK